MPAHRCPCQAGYSGLQAPARCRVEGAPTSTGCLNLHSRRHRLLVVSRVASAAPPVPVAAQDDQEVEADAASIDGAGEVAPQLKKHACAADPFEELGVDARMSKLLLRTNITGPSDIQRSAIPALLQGTSAALQSFTGSGKTLAFLLPTMTRAIQQLEQQAESTQGEQEPGPDVVIISPSRELCMQIVRQARALLPRDAHSLIGVAIGGANMARQEALLRKHQPIIVVGSAGRLADYSKRGLLRTHHTRMLVLDEADQLLCPQFAPELLRIARHLGRKLDHAPQVIATSATIAPQMLHRVQNLMEAQLSFSVITADSIMPADDLIRQAAPHLIKHAAVRVAPTESASSSVAGAPAWGWGSDSGFWQGRTGAAPVRGSAGGVGGGTPLSASLPPGLQHCYVVAQQQRDHTDTLRSLIHALNAKRVMVFMNHQRRLKDVMHKLGRRDVAVCQLHGEMGKQQRAAVVDGFRNGRYRVMLVSDVVARGLDIQDCDCVVHMELPTNATHYAHRAGRAGRMGRPGVVASIVSQRDSFVVQRFQKELGIELPRALVQGGRVTYLDAGTPKTLGRFDEVAAQPAQIPEPEQDIVQQYIRRPPAEVNQKRHTQRKRRSRQAEIAADDDLTENGGADDGEQHAPTDGRQSVHHDFERLIASEGKGRGQVAWRDRGSAQQPSQEASFADWSSAGYRV